MAKLSGSYYQAKQDDEPRKGIVQQIMQKSTDFLRRIIVPVHLQEGVTLSCVCRPCHRTSREDHIRWVSTEHGDSSKKGEKQCNWWCAACGGQNKWKDLNSVLVIQDSTDPNEANVFRAHVPPRCACENLVCALVFLAIQQTGGVSLVDMIFQGLQEQNWLKTRE